MQPKPASRVRLLQAGDTNKNDPDDALPVAVAALRSRTQREVAAADYPAVLKVLPKRHRDLARARNQVACRLQKISGRLASDDVTQDRLDIRSYIDTARKHGKNPMDVLHDLMLGRPWRPPAPALSP